MADVIIQLTIQEAKVPTALQGFLAIYPNNEKNPDDSPKYTDKQWVTEMLRRIAVRDIRRGLQILANQAAAVAQDDTMVQ